MSEVYIPIMMLTGSAETPRVTDINTSNNKPPIRIENATHRGLKQPCHKEWFDAKLKKKKQQEEFFKNK